jgi:hypothetical protein
MKFRSDFVTNSSSSSFVCDFCGCQESGMDMCLSDAQMYECENGHTVCECHVDINWEKLVRDLISDDIESNKKWTEKYPENSQTYIDENIAKELMLSRLNEMPEDELIDLANDYDFESSLPQKFCPLCNFTSMTSDDMKKYLLDKFDLSEEYIKGDK